MQSTDREHFFETDASQLERARKAAKANNGNGSPLTMKSKILAAIPDPFSPLSSIFIAESAGFVRRISLHSAEPRKTYRGPKAPVTCLAVGGNSSQIVFGGCWDKDIWSWNIESGLPLRSYSGHSDFVKALVTSVISGKHVLISGGADKKIMVWDIETGQRLHVLQDPITTMLSVQSLAIDPVLTDKDAVVFASGSSDPFIRRWKVTLHGTEQLAESHDEAQERPTIQEHETSVYKVWYDADGEDVDLWTASADGTAKCLGRGTNFSTDDAFEHGDYVKAVSATEQWVITAGRNEDVKIWNRATGKLYTTLEGHFEEITDLILLRDAQGQARSVCSVSIDATIRTWPLDKSLLDEVIEKIREAAKPKENGEVEEEEDEHKESLLTAEEEAELAELMGDP